MSNLKPSDTLQEAVNAAAFLSTEVQMHFGELVGDADWEVDFGAVRPTLTFTQVAGAGTGDRNGAGADDTADESAAGDVVLRAHLAGSLAERQGTWHWGWDNINEFPEPVVARAAQILEYGRAHEIPELTSAEVKADADQAQRFTLAAKLATDIWDHYPAEAGPQTTASLLVQGPALALGDPEIRPIVMAMAASLQQIDVTDHRAALESYARLRGFPLTPIEGGLRILTASGSADVTFDDMRRLTNCQMHAPLEGEAATQFAEAGAVTPTAGIGRAAEDLEPDTTAPAEAPRQRETETRKPEPQNSSATEQPAATPVESAPKQPAATPVESAPKRPESPERSTTPAQEPAPERPAANEPAAPSEETAKKKGFFKKLFGR